MTSPLSLHGKCDPRFTVVRYTRAFSKSAHYRRLKIRTQYTDGRP
jgi:hypothetical protein